VSRDPIQFLKDIENSCAKIIRYTEGLSRDEAFADELKLDGVLMNLYVIGEAVKGLPEDLRLRHFDVPWREISGMRDFIAHVYFAIDLDIVWKTTQEDVPALLHRVRDIIKAEEEEA